MSDAADLYQTLTGCYPDQHLAVDFYERYQDAHTALRRKAIASGQPIW